MAQEAAGVEFVPGQIIAGRFRLERLLGKGGMGAVWAARHLNLNVDVALKFVDSSVVRRGDVMARFAQEAQAAAQVKSPYVVNVLDYGAEATGRPYIAMELLQGEELARRLEREPRLPVADVGRIVSHACHGLGRAHAAGVVHRDLKPDNLFLVDDEEGFVTKVLDFGIAKANSPVGAVTHHTDTGEILGTPLYMSPEQALGTVEVDFRSDLYSLAVVAFRCLTGVVPFESTGLGELIVKVSTEPVPSARALRPDLPAALDAWFERAMHKNPSKRFSSARELGDAFLQACGLPSWAHSGPTPASPPSRTASPRRGEGPRVAPRELATLAGATATYSPPAVRSWVTYGAAAFFGTVFVCLLSFFKPFGQGARSTRDKLSPPAPSAVSAAPTVRAVEAAAKASAVVAEGAGSAAGPTPLPPPPSEAPAGEAEARREPSAEGAARRRGARPTAPAARPASPKGPPPKPTGIDWGIE